MDNLMEYEYGRYGVQQYGGFLVEDGVLADFPLVGSRRTVTNDFCGVFSKNYGCLESHLHVGKNVPVGVLRGESLDGKVHGLKALVFVQSFRCTDPLCPECCLHWAKLQVARAIKRFDAFIEAFDGYELEHIVVSVPRHDYDKDLKFLRSQAIAFASGVGAVGGMVIYHPKRYNRDIKCWYFSPHFHFVSFVYAGFVDGLLVRDVHNLSGYTLKKLPKRRSVYNTIMYQLSHAGVPDGRAHAVTWYGELNYRKGASLPKLADDELKPRTCPICGNSLVHLCRVTRPHQEFFDYEKYEGRFVLDDVDNWTVVSHRIKKIRYDDDG